MPAQRATGLMMNRAFAVLAASGVMSLAAAFALQSAAAMPLGQFQALGTAAEQMSVVVPVGCYKQEYFGDLGFCKRICSEWLPNDLQGYNYIWNTTNCSDNIFPTNRETCERNARGTVMLKHTSCKANPGTAADTCIITVCGPTNVLLSPKPKPTDRLRVEQPVPKPRVGPPQPGNSAMERLGGSGTAGAPSGGSQSSGGAAPKASGGGGASSATSSGGSSTPNINSNTIMKQAPAFGQTPGLR